MTGYLPIIGIATILAFAIALLDLTIIEITQEPPTPKL